MKMTEHKAGRELDDIAKLMGIELTDHEREWLKLINEAKRRKKRFKVAIEGRIKKRYRRYLDASR